MAAAGLNYISTVRSAPLAPGVTATVQDRDDRLMVRNRGRSTVTIYGYNREPYARIQPGGRVQINQRSPALYLNEDRYADVDVPRRANAKAAPVWKTLDNTGSFDWHDHRIHWMVKKRPGQGHGQGQADQDLRLEGARQGGRPPRGDLRGPVLGAATRRGLPAGRGNRSRRR